MSTLRSLLFLLFQLVVTPIYASVMLACSGFRACRCTASRRLVLDQSVGCALDLRHPRPGDRPREHSGRTARTPHIVMSKHSSTWETLALTMFFPPLAYVAKKELLSIPFFGWGFALASPITIDRKSGTHAMQQIATQGRERFDAGILDRGVSGRNADSRGHAREVQDRRRTPRRSTLGVPIVPVAHNAGWICGRRASSASDPAR